MSSVHGKRYGLQALSLIGLALAATTVLAAEPAAKVDLTEAATVTWLPEPRPIAGADAKTAAEMKAYTEEIPATGVKFDMVAIPGGKFTMGSPKDEKGHKDDEAPQHEVAVEPFWMGKCEVSWNEYELWSMGLDVQRRKVKNVKADTYDEKADAITRPTMPYTDMTFDMGKEGFPAICMTQLAAKVYCKWLSAKTGRYYRLPTEAEWEYAARAGSKTAYSFGDDPEKLGDFAWYYDNSDEKYHKVGTKKPNAWGLHDMHGNVSEWVLDQYVPDFYASAASKLQNPLAVPTKLYPRAVRGGSWDDDAEALRSATRRGSSKDWMMQDPQIPQSIWYMTDADFLGFRVVRPLTKPDAEKAKLYEPEYQAIKDYKEANAGKQ
jgi:formylglycine-generating enzyme required for sulfatase activity